MSFRFGHRFRTELGKSGVLTSAVAMKISTGTNRRKRATNDQMIQVDGIVLLNTHLDDLRVLVLFGEVPNLTVPMLLGT